MQNFCRNCKPGFYINTGNCLKASSQCRTFNVNTGACDSCYEGFAIRNRDCVSPTTLDPNEDYCELRSGTICIKCKDRYYLSYNAPMPTCAGVNQLCLTYNEVNGDCYTCVAGYSLNGGNCIQVMNPGTNTNTNPGTNTTPGSGTNLIEVPQIFCLEYYLPAQTCRTCYSGYFYSTQ